MFVSGRTKKRGRGSAAPPAPSTLGGRHKRAAKSPGSPSSSSRLSAERRTAALSIDPAEAGIVLDRLGKEVVSLLEAGGRKRDRVRRRLRMGINEVTKFLEATAASSDSNDCSSTSRSSRTGGSGGDGGGGGSGSGGDSGGGGAIVIISGDVRPARLVEHLHALVALTGTPYLVLPGGTSSSSTLGRMFGCKTMAAFAICAAPTPAPTPPPPSTPPGTTTTTTSTANSGTLGETTPTTPTKTIITNGETTPAATTPATTTATAGILGETPPLFPGRNDGSRIGNGIGDREVEVGVGVEVGGAGPEAGGGREGGEGGGGRREAEVDDLAGVDEDIDSFVTFLRRKVRVPPS